MSPKQLLCFCFCTLTTSINGPAIGCRLTKSVWGFPRILGHSHVTNSVEWCSDAFFRKPAFHWSACRRGACGCSMKGVLDTESPQDLLSLEGYCGWCHCEMNSSLPIQWVHVWVL
ncbi:hypothetical protein F4860DRAFT_463792 [Xylaria cubensis]|nr:hypothetical protein F4860DRAFT_463792 [Xylaria cubensis]